MFQFYRDLNRKSNQVKNCRAKIELLGSYDPQKQLIIEDPYYVSVVSLPSWCSQTRATYREPAWVPAVGGQRQAPWRRIPEWFCYSPFSLSFQGNDADFETVYQQCVRCCRAFLEKVRWPAVPLWPRLVPPGRVSSVNCVTVPSQGRSPLFSWLTVSYLKKKL